MTIEVIVKPNGETRLETKGFAGSACQDASKFLLESLGEKTCEQRTAEFYTTATVSHAVQVRPPS